MIESTRVQDYGSLGLYIGMLAPAAVVALIRLNESLDEVTFSRYLPSPSFEQRLANSPRTDLRNIHQEAKRLRSVTGNDLLQWESIVAASWQSSDFSFLFYESLFHDSKKDVAGTFRLTADEISGDLLQEQIASLGDEELLAICSLCQIKDGTRCHIPLMDFQCPPNEINLQKVKVALTEMNQHGLILESGKSYHFYGFDLLDQNEWLNFMANALLLAPFADSRYIAHRLLGGKCVLRISSSKTKSQVPVVVAII